MFALLKFNCICQPKSWLIYLIFSAKLAALQKPAEPEPQATATKVNGERSREASPMEDEEEEEEPKVKVKVNNSGNDFYISIMLTDRSCIHCFIYMYV